MHHPNLSTSRQCFDCLTLPPPLSVRIGTSWPAREESELLDVLGIDSIDGVGSGLLWHCYGCSIFTIDAEKWWQGKETIDVDICYLQWVQFLLHRFHCVGRHVFLSSSSLNPKRSKQCIGARKIVSSRFSRSDSICLLCCRRSVWCLYWMQHNIGRFYCSNHNALASD